MLSVALHSTGCFAFSSVSEVARPLPAAGRDHLAPGSELLKRSQHGPFPRIVRVDGQAFILLKGVFSPEVFWSTRLFSAMLPVRPGDVGHAFDITLFATDLRRKTVTTCD